jgi:5-methylcytosine-specific restriction protein A
VTPNSSWSGRHQPFPSATRRTILDRDQHTCQLSLAGCEGTGTIADHIVPQAEGGDHDITNGQAVCRSCHDIKTKAEIQRGRDRQPRNRRTPETHPGLLP